MLVGPFEATIQKYDGAPVKLIFCECHEKDEHYQFRVAMNTGAMPILEFAASAKSGLDTSTMDGFAALCSMLEDCIEPDDWDRFRSVAKQHKVKTDHLMKIATSIWAALSNRPLENSNSSEPGGQSTGQSSSESATDSSSTSTVAEFKKPANVRPRRKTAGSTSSR